MEEEKRLARKKKKKGKINPVEKEIRLLIESGDVLIGSRKGLKELLIGNPKAVIYASNLKKELLSSIDYYANHAEIIKVKFNGTSLDLGKLCGKPYPVSMLVVFDEGEADLDKLAKLV